jgi:hypothetical protein
MAHASWHIHAVAECPGTYRTARPQTRRSGGRASTGAHGERERSQADLEADSVRQGCARHDATCVSLGPLAVDASGCGRPAFGRRAQARAKGRRRPRASAMRGREAGGDGREAVRGGMRGLRVRLAGFGGRLGEARLALAGRDIDGARPGRWPVFRAGRDLRGAGCVHRRWPGHERRAEEREGGGQHALKGIRGGREARHGGSLDTMRRARQASRTERIAAMPVQRRNLPPAARRARAPSAQAGQDAGPRVRLLALRRSARSTARGQGK